ncbi:MAG: DUF4349 domain-containing protein [Caulobacterales bacterium]
MRTPMHFVAPVLAALIGIAALNACSRSDGYGGAKTASPEAAPVAGIAMEREIAAQDAVGGAAKADAPSQPAQANTPAGPVMLAYAYAMGIEAPLKSIPALAKTHEKACLAAGPQVCQVLGASNQSYGEDSVSAHLSLRAAPIWLAKFRAQIETDAKDAKGRVRENTVTSEDLTRAIVDTSAQLNAQKILRTRLENLLASRPGKLSDLLDVERELARVQGVIDSQESELAVMRQRVAMSVLEIDYRSQTLAVASGAFEPLVQAFKDIVPNIVAGLAAMVTILSILAVWLLVLVPAGYYGARYWKRRQARKVLARAKSEAASAPSVG